MSMHRLTVRKRGGVTSEHSARLSPCMPAAMEKRSDGQGQKPRHDKKSALSNKRRSNAGWTNMRERLELALPGKNELLARFEHALAMEMIHILGRRG